jgi:hypothetical protein
VAGDALHQRIVDAVGGELVIGRQQLEHGRLPEDQVGLLGSDRRCGRDREDEDGEGERAGQRHESRFPWAARDGCAIF